MNKKEMITVLNNKLEQMTEKGIQTISDIVTAMMECDERYLLSTSQERIAELNAIELQKTIDKEKAKEDAYQNQIILRNQTYVKYAKVFDAINTVNIPTRYDLKTDEIEAIDLVNGNILRFCPQETLDISRACFKYGFVKGTRYAKVAEKRKEKKKATDANQ